MDSQRRIETFEPANPHNKVASVPQSTGAQIEEAVIQAELQTSAWATDAAARSVGLRRWGDAVESDAAALASLLAAEVGKPITEARAEVDRAISILMYYAQAPYEPIGEEYPVAGNRARLAVRQRPLGTVLLITPWNFPVAIPAWKMAPALAYGNTVLFKPSSAAVGTATRFVGLARDALPAGVLHTILGGGPVTEPLLADARVSGVSFTGSALVGATVVGRVASRGGAVQAEMGGQNPSVVLEDADLDFSAATIANASMAYAGQKCTATSRVIVLASIARRFRDLLVDHVRSLRVGDPSSTATQVGPLISSAARDAVDKAVSAARRRGARVLAGASSPPGQGWYYEPTLLEVGDGQDAFVQEETFGPAAALMIANTEDDAIALANNTRFGLAAAVFGSDVGHAEAVALRVRAGLLRVNASTTGVDFYAPFGGDGASSYGEREQGRAARHFYSTTQTILVRPSESSR